jgi:hypothetical protein
LVGLLAFLEANAGWKPNQRHHKLDIDWRLKKRTEKNNLENHNIWKRKKLRVAYLMCRALF